MRLTMDPLSSKRLTIPGTMRGFLLLMIPEGYEIEGYDRDSFYPDWVIVPELKYPILIDLSEVKE